MEILAGVLEGFVAFELFALCEFEVDDHFGDHEGDSGEEDKNAEDDENLGG